MKYIDPLESGWRQFVMEIRSQNKTSNDRLCRLLRQIKGEEFVDDLKAFMKSIGHEYGLLRVSRKPQGMLLNDNRFETIKEVWIDQRSSPHGPSGVVYIQVKPNRWVTIGF
jgi:hypothetical protein